LKSAQEFICRVQEEHVIKVLKAKSWVVLVVAAAVAAAIGIAHATIPDQGGVIHGCYGKSGQLRVIDAPTESCRADETALNWNQTGQPGPRGPAGPTGPAGPGTLNSAAVATSGFQDLPFEVGATLRAGTYVIWAVVEFYGDDSSGFNSQCTFWEGAVGFDNGGKHIGAVGDSAVFSGKDEDRGFGHAVLLSTATLSSDTSILLYCSSQDGDAKAVGRIVTVKVDGIN
jgi:hypothetical protein